MNTRTEAFEQIKEFLLSNEKGMLLTGTHQYEKHPLVMKAISEIILKPSTILFRANGMQNLDSIFKNVKTNFKTGVDYKLGNHKLFIDTISSSSWKSTMNNYDFAILYPVDSSLRSQNTIKTILDDLYDFRQIEKIFLVSWTDNKQYDYGHLLENNYVQRHVIYDALEERPDYHQRVLDNISR